MPLVNVCDKECYNFFLLLQWCSGGGGDGKSGLAKLSTELWALYMYPLIRFSK